MEQMSTFPKFKESAKYMLGEISFLISKSLTKMKVMKI